MIIHVKVKPNSSKKSVEGLDNGKYLVNVKSAPENNKANVEVVKLLSKEFKIPVKDIKIKSGKTSRKKIIEVG